MRKPRSSGKPAREPASQKTRPGQFSLILLLGVTAYIAMFFGIVASLHVITGVGFLMIAGTILLWTAGFACALAGVALLLGVICALERKTADDRQEPVEAALTE